ncbi:MAG: hypothetical protein KatS3mg129_3098 [Leptospiraceae bacterium]|nr:MAG: hypothetical protein KatS3mg129_3098 [Leptospiraceae bacterium]
MKTKLFILFSIISIGLFVSDIKANPNGKNIFTSKGCAACHQPAVDSVGPSLKNISSAYKGNLGQLIDFLKGNGKPLLEKGKFAGQYDSVMKLQLNQIKNLPAKDLKDLAQFILSH